MSSSKILLSWRERKALFRASQIALTAELQSYREFADDLCDQLDDGGIWNPCFILVDDREDGTFSNPAFSFNFILNYGQRMLPEYRHTLMMIKDRFEYTRKRSVEKTQYKKPPFLTASDYYGPDWKSVREKAIERDNAKCVSCGMTRATHREKYEHDLHVHHITPLREIGDYKVANELQNLKTLCSICHTYTEKS
jgi:ribosomal protein S27AE